MAVNIGSLFGEVVIDTRKMEKGLKKARRNLANFGRSASGAGRSIASGIVAPIAGLGVITAKTFANFEQEMQKVKAVSGATDNEFLALEKSAMDLGASTRFAASEVAGLQLNLSKLGFDPREINQSTEAILNLALASGEDLASSAGVAGATLRAFNLDASEMSRVADVMAKSFSSSALDLEKFSVAMPKMAKAAESAGFSLEEATAMLGILANNGIEASTAGTNLRNIFISMAEKGITLAQAIEEVNNSQDKLTAGTELFDKRTAVAILTLSQSTQAIRDLAKELDLAEGSASEMAKVMDDSVTGAFFRLRSVLEAVQIAIMKANGRDSGLQGFLDNISKTISANKKLIVEKSELVLKVGLVSTAFSGLLLLAGQLAFALKNVAGACIFLNRVVVGSLIVGLAKLRKAILVIVVTLGILTGAGGVIALVKAGIVGLIAVLGGIKATGLIDLGTEAETASNKIKLASNEIKLLRENFDTYEEALNSLGDTSIFAEQSIAALKQAFEETGENALITAQEIKNISTEISNMSKEEFAKELADIMADTALSSENLADNTGRTVKEMQSLEGVADRVKSILKDMLGSFDDFKANSDFFKFESDIFTSLFGDSVQAKTSSAEVFAVINSHIDKMVQKKNKAIDVLKSMQDKARDSVASMDEVLDLMDKHAKETPTTIRDALEQFGNSSKNAGEMALHAMEQASDGMTNALMNFFEEGRSGLKQFASDFLRQMAKLTLQQNVVNPLVSGLSGFITGALGVPTAPVKPAGKAMGGAVTASTPYMVGERGAELFVPAVNGTIVPNHALAGTPPVNVTFNVQATDAQSFDNQLAQREQMFVGMIDKAFNKRGRVGING